MEQIRILSNFTEVVGFPPGTFPANIDLNEFPPSDGCQLSDVEGYIEMDFQFEANEVLDISGCCNCGEGLIEVYFVCGAYSILMEKHIEHLKNGGEIATPFGERNRTPLEW